MRHTAASVVLDALRLLAAQAVCLGHAISIFGVLPGLQPPNFPYMQNVGVQVFFVLSGFLIAYTLGRNAGFFEYVIDRFSRIYSTLVPALIFVLAVDLALDLPGTRDLKTFAGSILMLENWRGPLRDHIAVPSFGTASPLWTLALEWHIYIFVGALWFARRSPRLLVAAAIFAPMPLAYLLGDGNLGTGAGLFSLWLLGFAGFHLVRNLERVRAPHLFAAGIAAAVAYLAVLQPGREFQIEAYPLLAIAFLCLCAIAMRRRATAMPVLVRVAAGYSFTLYLVHHTILLGLRSVWDGGTAGALVAVLLANLVALAIAIPTEMRHKALAGWLRARFTDHRRPQPSFQR